MKSEDGLPLKVWGFLEYDAAVRNALDLRFPGKRNRKDIDMKEEEHVR
jgi:hypothetical protein